MKSVNELSISPMPWVAMDNGTVASQDTDGELFEVCDCWGCRDEANARLIAAAPELYCRLFKIVDWLKRMNEQRLDAWATSEWNPSSSFRRETFAQLIEDNKYHIEMGIQALAKAAGEEIGK